MTRKIIALIPLDGLSKGDRHVEFRSEGYTGASCQEATRSFEDALGTTVDEEMTEEFYQSEDRHEHLNDGSGGDDPEG